MGHFVDLSTAIVSVLGNVQQDGSAAFNDIVEWPTLEFTGFPAVTIAPSDSGSDYATIVQNFRDYVFQVDMFVPVEDPTNTTGYEVAFGQMRVLVDTVLDAFDNSNTLNDTCQILTPVASNWLVVETSASVMLSARVNLHCKTTVATNNG